MDLINVYPIAAFVFSFVLLSLATSIGIMFQRKQALENDSRDDFNVVLAAVLTLLALITSFALSMAVSRFDLRKTWEEGEANAIGTEHLRADLLPAADGARVRLLLRSYLEQRVLFYSMRQAADLNQIEARSAELQTQLWAVVKNVAEARPTPTVALAVAGMNDVLNAQGYAQAARTNPIPAEVWVLLWTVSSCGAVLIGYGARSAGAGKRLRLVLPVLVSLSFFLIADIDSPSAGLIRVRPVNLDILVQSFRAH